MPEGPEIRRAADQVAEAIAGSRLTEVHFDFERLRPFEDELRGQRVDSVDTHGKAMLTRFEGGLTLYSHNQLYGRWYVRQNGQDPDTNRQLRVGLRTATHSALLYSASDIDVVDRQALAEHPFLRGLGPDPLWPETTAASLVAWMERPEFVRRQLGALLLDQGFVAGLGNYLRSEILWRARLHPKHRPVDLDEPQRRALARELLRLPRRSYDTGGVTNTRKEVRQLERLGATWPKSRFAVFAREGQPCLECGSPVERIEVGSRRLYLCSCCQPGPTR